MTANEAIEELLKALQNFLDQASDSEQVDHDAWQQWITNAGLILNQEFDPYVNA